MAKVTPETKVPFGKPPQKGAKMKNLTDNYLKWMIEKLPDTDLHEFAKVAKQVLDNRAGDPVLDLNKQADEWLKERGYDKHGRTS